MLSQIFCIAIIILCTNYHAITNKTNYLKNTKFYTFCNELYHVGE